MRSKKKFFLKKDKINYKISKQYFMQFFLQKFFVHYCILYFSLNIIYIYFNIFFI